MSGDSSKSESNTVTTQTPWAPAAPYLKGSLKSAANLFAQGPAQYTPWSQVQGLDPMQKQAMQGVMDYTNSGDTQKFMNTASGATQDLIRGGNNTQAFAQQGVNQLGGYLGNNRTMDSSKVTNQMAYGDNTNPYLEANTKSALNSMSSNFLQNTLPGMRRQASGDGSFGSSRNEMAEGQALGALDNQMQQKANEMYQADYWNNEQNRVGALGTISQQQNNQAQFNQSMLNQGTQQKLSNQQAGLANYLQTLGMPLNMIQSQLGIGQQQFDQDAAQLKDASNRWNFQQGSGWDNLAKYRALLDPSSKYTATTSNESSSTPSDATGNALATAATLAALYGAYSGT
jgi:hypothetical protein